MNTSNMNTSNTIEQFRSQIKDNFDNLLHEYIQDTRPSLYFNGSNSNGVIADDSNLSFTSGTGDRPFSIIIKFKNLRTGSIARYPIAKIATSNYEYDMFLSATNVLNFRLWSPDTTKRLQLSGEVIPDNFTGTITITYDGNATNIKYYLNGIAKTGTVTNTGGYTNMTNGIASVSLGQALGGGNIHAEYCDVYMYNCELSAAEVLANHYDSVAYYHKNASNTILTTGSIILGKKYKVISAGTGIIVNGATQTGGTELVATSTTVTWNGGSLIQIGCVLDLMSKNANSIKFSDASGNNLYADLSNVEIINQGLSHESNLPYKNITGNSTVVIPKGYLIDQIYIKNTTANAITGGIKIGTTAGGTDVISAFAVAGNFNGVVSDATLLKKFFSDTANTTLYLQAVTAWNSASINVVIGIRRIV